MKTGEQNRNNKRTEKGRIDWFIERIQTRLAFGWLLWSSERSGEKMSCLRTFWKSTDTSLWRCCNTNGSFEQYLLHIRVFFGCFGGKTKSPCFDLFIHWLIKQITNAYRNHFSRSSYENRSSGSLFPSNVSNFRISGVSVIVSVRPAFTHLTVPESGAPPGPEAWTGRASPRKPL